MDRYLFNIVSLLVIAYHAGMS